MLPKVAEIDAQIDKSQIDVDILLRQSEMSEALMEAVADAYDEVIHI